MVKDFMKNINSSSNIFSEVWRKHLTLNKNTECQNIYFLYLGAFLVSCYIKSSKKKKNPLHKCFQVIFKYGSLVQ